MFWFSVLFLVMELQKVLLKTMAKKQDRIVLSAISKLISIEILISKALEDSINSRQEHKKIMNGER